MVSAGETRGRLLLLAGGSAVALLLGEGTLRLLDPFQERLRGDQLTLAHDVRYAIENPSNPRLERHIEHSKNALGFRGPDLPRDREGLLVTFALGGSTTECFYLSDGKDWPSLVGTRLKCSVPGFWIDNAGLDGHSTFGQRLLLEQRILPLRPAVVLFLVGANDVAREDLRPREGHRRPPTLVERVARHSSLISAAVNVWRARRARARGLGHEAIDLATLPHLPTDERRLASTLGRHRREFLPAYGERLAGLVKLCRDHDALPVLMSQPSLLGSGRDDATNVDLGTVSVGTMNWGRASDAHWNGAMAWAVLESYNDVTREVGARLEVPVIDLARELPKTSRFFYDALHFTNEGSAEAARIVATRLCDVLARRLPDRPHADCGCVSERRPP